MFEWIAFLVVLIVLVIVGFSLRMLLKLEMAERFNQLAQTIQDAMQKGRQEGQEQVKLALNENAHLLSERMKELTDSTDKRLQQINERVEKRLSEGLAKTTETFADIVKRLALIDHAQQKITELSSNVVSLKEILVDKRSRGAFGEVQLNSLIRNVLPEQHFEFQHVLSNDKRADCMLYLPEPTGNIVIDAKFPLENFQKLMDVDASDADRKAAEQAFRRDIKTHIQDIASKYICPPETTDGAIMFIPAEAVFAEIHAHYPDLVEASHRAKVWLASPTTMMAILTTAKSVLKDDATKKQVHLIQEHLGALSKDFGRFQKRMDGLERHISLANDDMKNINVSARKITSRFEKIEQVELSEQTVVAVEAAAKSTLLEPDTEN